MNDIAIGSLVVSRVIEDPRALFETARFFPDSTEDAIAEARGLKQLTDTGAIEAVIDQIIASEAAKVAEYRSGKDKLFGYFVGQAMKATQGKANPKAVNEILRARLSAS